MARQQVKAAPIQRAIGVSQTAWHTYFVKCSGDVPLPVVVGVAEYLGLSASELLRRAVVAAQERVTLNPERSAHAS